MSNAIAKDDLEMAPPYEDRSVLGALGSDVKNLIIKVDKMDERAIHEREATLQKLDEIKNALSGRLHDVANTAMVTEMNVKQIDQRVVRIEGKMEDIQISRMRQDGVMSVGKIVGGAIMTLAGGVFALVAHWFFNK